MGKRNVLGALLVGVGLGLVLCQGWPAVCLVGHGLYICGVAVLFGGEVTRVRLDARVDEDVVVLGVGLAGPAGHPLGPHPLGGMHGQKRRG